MGAEAGCQRFTASVSFDGDGCGRGAGLVGAGFEAGLGLDPAEDVGVAFDAGVGPGTPGVVAARLSTPAFTSNA